MGCFLACFGVTNDRSPRRPRRHRLNDVSPRSIRNQGDQCKFVGKQLSPALKQDDLEKLKTLTEYSRVESGEQRSSEARKKVTFDSNITSYKHVSVDEVAVISPHCGEVAENLVVGDSVKATNSASVPQNGLVSYRYQSYREDEDENEEEELHRERTDLEVDRDESENNDDHDGSFDELDYDNSEDESRHGTVCPKTQTMAKVSLQSLVDSEINESMSYVQTLDIKRSTMGCDHGARDRSRYVSSVLNPVENTAQWKSVKAKDTVLLKPQKENKSSKEEPYSSSVDPFSHKSGAKSDESKHIQEIAVDASLSTWLVSNEKTPKAKTKTTGLEAIPSHGPHSLRSKENKLMPGFLTVEQIKKFSASSTPKRSPIRNLDDTPITDSCSVSSFKGIPNTTSKYREDKRVNWHSTPFETRLDRALNKSTGQSYSTSSAWLRATEVVE